jgi:hypothetical protein
MLRTSVHTACESLAAGGQSKSPVWQGAQERGARSTAPVLICARAGAGPEAGCRRDGRRGIPSPGHLPAHHRGCGEREAVRGAERQRAGPLVLRTGRWALYKPGRRRSDYPASPLPPGHENHGAFVPPHRGSQGACRGCCRGLPQNGDSGDRQPGCPATTAGMPAARSAPATGAGATVESNGNAAVCSGLGAQVFGNTCWHMLPKNVPE